NRLARKLPAAATGPRRVGASNRPGRLRQLPREQRHLLLPTRVARQRTQLAFAAVTDLKLRGDVRAHPRCAASNEGRQKEDAMKRPELLTRLPLGLAATPTATSLVGDYVGVLPVAR